MKTVFNEHRMHPKLTRKRGRSKSNPHKNDLFQPFKMKPVSEKNLFGQKIEDISIKFLENALLRPLAPSLTVL